MSRRDRGRAGAAGNRRAGTDPPSGPRRVRGRSRWLVAAAVLMAVAVIGWLVLRPRHAPPGAARDAAVREAESMTPEAAYTTALRLSRAGHHEQSLPYYRRALTGTPENPWVVHYNYGGALYNIGLEVRDRHGVAVPAVRSSIERVALMRAALAEMDAAEQLAISARDRATVMRARGERFQIWGFPWDAFVQLRQAQWTDPARAELSGAADAYMRVLEHPEQK